FVLGLITSWRPCSPSPVLLCGVCCGASRLLSNGRTTPGPSTLALHDALPISFTLELPAGTSSTWAGNSINLSDGGVLVNAGTLGQATPGCANKSSKPLPARLVNTGTVTVNAGRTSRSSCSTLDGGQVALHAGT